ncbi:unnamed protein product [Rotaria socialis]
MPFIDFKCIDVQSLDESSTITAEEIQQDKAVRQSNFMRALEMANTIIDHNPEVLVFYWYMWTCRDRTYSNSLPLEQITRRTVKRMPVPTEEEQLCMKQHTKLFTAVLRSDRINYAGQVLYANTKALIQLQFEFSNHIFIIDDDNSRLLFVCAVILHELVHIFEPTHIDLEKEFRLFCEVFNTQRRSADPPKATYEVGEIFETMLFGGTAVRYNENEIRRCGDADDNEAHFFINDDRQYHRFFITYDLAILRYIPKRKRQFITIRRFFRTIRQHVTNITSMQRQQINN